MIVRAFLSYDSDAARYIGGLKIHNAKIPVADHFAEFTVEIHDLPVGCITVKDHVLYNILKEGALEDHILSVPALIP